MSEPTSPTPDELLRMVLAPSDGATPAGTLQLIQALAAQEAIATGAALPEVSNHYRPETPEERSGKIIAAQVLAAHAIDQSEAENPSRGAARDQLVTTENVAALNARNAEAMRELRAVLAQMAEAGFAVAFELQTAAVGAVSG